MKSMKRSMLVVVATLFLTLQGFAQKQLSDEEKAQRRAITLENRCNELAAAMALDDEQAERFRPLYVRYTNEMQQARKQHKMHRAKRANLKTGESGQPLTDEQIDENIRKRFALSRAIIDIREKYYLEFRQFMNPKQIQRMYDSEKRQGEKMHQAQKHRKQQGKGHTAHNGAPRPMNK